MCLGIVASNGLLRARRWNSGFLFNSFWRRRLLHGVGYRRIWQYIMNYEPTIALHLRASAAFEMPPGWCGGYHLACCRDYLWWLEDPWVWRYEGFYGGNYCEMWRTRFVSNQSFYGEPTVAGLTFLTVLSVCEMYRMDTAFVFLFCLVRTKLWSCINYKTSLSIFWNEMSFLSKVLHCKLP